MITLLLRKSKRVCVGLFCVFLLTLVPNVNGASYVVAWGDDRDERTSVPPGITNGLRVAGLETSFALLSDGTVMGWGTYDTGAGNVPPGLSDVAAVAAGWFHTLLLRSNGTVTVWGSNSFGQTNLPAGLTNVTKIAAGYNHSTALKSNGTVAAWGYYGNGAINVPPGLTNVVAIAAGGAHSLVLKSDGTVVAWGDNSMGQTNVPSGLTNVLAVAAGETHSLALRSDHTVIAWGRNLFGQTNVPVSLSNVMVIAAGETHNLAITSDGRLVAWGHPSRTNTPPGLTNVTAISAGRFHSLAVVTVADGAPVITRHPSDRYIYRGMPTTLTITVEGVPLPVCQWRFNGTAIDGATNLTLALTNVSVAASGDYGVVVSNAQGSAVSVNAKLTVTDSMPFIEIQPQGNPVYAGDEYTLSVRANGSWPLLYQWRFNTNAIPGATNSSLSFSNFQLTNEGYYDVVISNQFGAKVSNPVFLNYFNLGDALNTNLLWATTGDAQWFGVNGWPNNDYFVPAARSGRINNNQSSSIQTTVTGPGTLRFAWMVSSQPTVDYLAFTINGVERARISGNDANDFTDWTTTDPPFYLGLGTHELRWTFHKNSGSSSGNTGWLEGDTGWLDRVTYTNGATLPIITSQPGNKVVRSGSNVTFSCTAEGTPPLNFQWQFNGANLTGAIAGSLTLTNVQPSQRGSYHVVVSNSYGTAISSNATLSVDYIGSDVPTAPLNLWHFRDAGNYNRVRFAGNLFFAFGPNGALATSEDGANWISLSTGVTAALSSVAFGQASLPPFESTYVAVGQAGTILISANGTNWSTVATTNTCDLNDVVWSGLAFVAVTTRAVTGQPNALRSFNGTDWTTATFPGGAPDQFGPFVSSAIKYANGVFIAAGGIPFTYDLWRSVNGTTWSLVGDSQQVVGGITHGNDRFFLAGMEGSPMASTNAGLNWFYVGDSNVCNQAPPFPWCMAATDVAFGNGTFILVRPSMYSVSGTSILTSTNTTNWIARAGGNFESVTYGKGTFVAVGPNGIFQSGDVATPILSIARNINDTNLILRSTGEIGRPYRLQSSTNLSAWVNVVSFTNTSPTAELTVPLDSSPTKLFRVISP